MLFNFVLFHGNGKMRFILVVNVLSMNIAGRSCIVLIFVSPKS